MDKKVIELTEGWRFHLGECEQAWYRGYDDSSWRKVYVPHDWSVEAPFSKDYSSGTGYLQGGIGWYRLRFTLPEEYRGKSVRVNFDGVYKNSQVWCNSYYLGKRPNGYIGFSYDISDFAVFGEAGNEISVKVTHTDLADSRWFTGSGITRKVTLTVEEPVHPAEYGCFFETPGIEADGGARVRVTHRAVNKAGKAVRLGIATAFYDPSGEEVLRMSKDTALSCNGGGALYERLVTDGMPLASQTAGNSGGQLVMEGIIPRPSLWSVDSPVLYTMKTWYRVEGEDARQTQAGEPETGEDGWYLADEEKVGIRTFSFDPDRGFSLNGRPMKLKGGCLHHDGGCLGAAMKTEVWQRRLELLKGCGCNAIRCSHNPHMPELYALCDAMGFVVMDEAFDEWENPKNKWSTGHNVYPPRHQGYYEDFPQWHEADLRAMVRRDRNHPSVILYSIGNEIDYPNDPYCHPMFDTMTGNNDANKPEAERLYDADRPNAGRLAVLAKRLADIVREEDASRPVTLAAAFPELSSRLGFLDPLDVVGYNYKEHLYDEDHKRFPHKPFLGSENGHSYQAWRAAADRDYISGQFLWTAIDYLGEAHGWPVYGSPAGLITTAGFVKPEWYRRRAFWGKGTGLHIATKSLEEYEKNQRKRAWNFMSHSWNYEPGQEVLVRCWVNEESLPEEASVALSCNERMLGSVRISCDGRMRENASMPEGAELSGDDRMQEKTQMPEGKEPSGCRRIYREDGALCFVIPFEAGRLSARCMDREGRILDECALETTGAAAELSCGLWQEPDASSGESFEICSGRPGYLYQLLLSLKDGQGRDVVWQEQCVKVQVTGDGELAGLDNGNLSDLTPYTENSRSTCNGRLAVYVRRIGAGAITVCMTALGEPASSLLDRKRIFVL